jgi:hypothetical protein
LIRGNFYAGWNPSAVPEKYDAEAYAARFAGGAIIAASGENLFRKRRHLRGRRLSAVQGRLAAGASTLQSQPWWPPAILAI